MRVGDLELEVGVPGLRDDVLDKPGGNALASGPLGDGDELDVARAVRVVEVRCPLWSQNSCGNVPRTRPWLLASQPRAPAWHGPYCRASDCSDDVVATICDAESVRLHCGCEHGRDGVQLRDSAENSR